MSFVRRFALACSLVCTVPAAATAGSIFLYIPGVPGQSTEVGHPNWIDVGDLSLGVSNRACSAVTFSKSIDTSSPVLAAAALTGGVYPSMTFDVVRRDEQRSVFLTYVLANVTVASVTQRAGEDGSVNEDIAVTPAAVTLTYRPQLNGGGPGTPITYTLPCVKK